MSSHDRKDFVCSSLNCGAGNADQRIVIVRLWTRRGVAALLASLLLLSATSAVVLAKRNDGRREWVASKGRKKDRPVVAPLALTVPDVDQKPPAVGSTPTPTTVPPTTAPPTPEPVAAAPAPTAPPPTVGAARVEPAPAPAPLVPPATVTAPPPPPAPPTLPPAPPGPTAPAGAVSVRDFGAVGDGQADDTAALVRAVAALRPGGTLWFPAGTYRYGAVLRVQAAGATLAGAPGAVLESINHEQQAIVVQANDVTVQGLRLTGATVRRYSAIEQTRVTLYFVSGGVVRNVQIDSGSAAGIMVWGSTDYLIENNVVRNTRADGIHQTQGSRRGRVVGNRLQNVGDDCIAVVSYRPSGLISGDVVVSGNECVGGLARGLAVVGGENVRLENNRIVESAAAGVYLASESSWDSFAATNVTVVGNRLERTNTNATLGHGAIFLWGRTGTASASGRTVSLTNDLVIIRNNVVIDTVGGPGHVHSVDANSRRVDIAGNTFSGGKAGLSLKLAPSSYNSRGNTVNGAPLPEHVGDASLL
jgi:parallel beta-helix repeat protein